MKKTTKLFKIAPSIVQEFVRSKREEVCLNATLYCQYQLIQALTSKTGLCFSDICERVFDKNVYFALRYSLKRYTVLYNSKANLPDNYENFRRVKTFEEFFSVLNHEYHVYCERRKDFDYEKETASEAEWANDVLFSIEQLSNRERRRFNLESKSDLVVSLHIPTVFSEAIRANKANLIRSLRVTGEKIRASSREVVAVIGKSWLMSTAVAARLGFSKTREIGARDWNLQDLKYYKKTGINIEYWGQVIDSEGEVKKGVVEYIQKHGRLRFPVTYGKMDTTQFLNRFCPDPHRERNAHGFFN